MTEDAITDYIISNFPGAEVIRPEEAGGPDIANGDRFFMHSPDPQRPAKMPFATIVTKDYGELDNASRLNRDGVFRLNVGVGKETFRLIVGTSAESERDYSVLDRILPHPVYAAQSWVCILNPSDETFHELLAPLLAEAYQIAGRRDPKQQPVGDGHG